MLVVTLLRSSLVRLLRSPILGLLVWILISHFINTYVDRLVGYVRVIKRYTCNTTSSR